jgi:hypothetical protein
MAPTLPVEFGPKAIRQPGRFVLFGRAISQTGPAGAPQVQTRSPFPRSTGVVFPNPAAILAQSAFSSLAKLTRNFATNLPRVRFGHASAGSSGLVRPDVYRPEIVVRQAASSQRKSGRTSAPFRPQARR